MKIETKFLSFQAEPPIYTLGSREREREYRGRKEEGESADAITLSLHDFVISNAFSLFCSASFSKEMYHEERV